MTTHLRHERLGDHYTPRPLSQFVEAAPVRDIDLSKYAAMSKAEQLEKILIHKKWRHHHGIAELETRDDLYVAYVRRIEEMLTLIRDALSRSGLLDSLGEKSIVDLAASEGFVSTRLVDWGATSIDAFELSDGGLERFGLVWNYLDYAAKAHCGLYQLDFEQVNWAGQLDAPYDLVFALGIIYHLENPLLFARNLYEATNEVCIIESDTPIFDEPQRFRGNGVVYLNKDQVTLSVGNVRKLIEFRPDREALIDMMLTAGFRSAEVLEPPPEVQGTFFARGEKSVLLCMK
jgi:2-polyprenyl-3-methyl-5-hydroxy-6-metoxy-1,4-benzoquinol methylase